MFKIESLELWYLEYKGTLLDNNNVPMSRTGIILQELRKYNIDIAALSETRLADEEVMTESTLGYTLYWKGLSKCENRLHGVGLVVDTKLTSYIIEKPVALNERIMYMRNKSPHTREMRIYSVCTPNLGSAEEVKENFYENLQETLDIALSKENIIILGDFNARDGRNSELWEDIIGTHGIGIE